MNHQTSLTRLAVACGVALLFSAGCGPKTERQQKRAAAMDKKAEAVEAQRTPKGESATSQQHGWNIQTLTTAYDRVGKHYLGWDDPAHKALDAFARVRVGGQVMLASDIATITQNSSLAVQKGCSDPLIVYLNLRFPTKTEQPAAIADRYMKMADEMAKSEYPPIRKFYASLRAAEATATGYPMDVEKNYVIARYLEQSCGYLQSIAKDKSTPVREVFEACDALFERSPIRRDLGDVNFLPIKKQMAKTWPKEGFPDLLEGHFYLEFAWRERGGGFADTVTERGWKLFRERLNLAEEALARAWLLDPSDARITVAFLRLELAQGKNPDRMEMWFQRGMQIDPNNFDACMMKLTYLEPKWYGSAEEMIRFGRECVTNISWKGSVPLTLVEAHWRHANYHKQNTSVSYWKQPGVWEDIKSAYDRYFEYTAKDNGRLSYYARYAAWCEKWDALEQLLQRLDQAGAGNFAERANYEKALQAARTGRTLPSK